MLTGSTNQKKVSIFGIYINVFFECVDLTDISKSVRQSLK